MNLTDAVKEATIVQESGLGTSTLINYYQAQQRKSLVINDLPQPATQPLETPHRLLTQMLWDGAPSATLLGQLEEAS